MDALMEQARDVFEDYYDQYYDQLLEKIPVFSTQTYVLTILAICIPPIIALVFYEREQARLLADQPKGCRKLGMKIESNLLNEFEKKFSEGRPPSTEETSAEWWRLKSLWIYPIKSCRGVELNRGTILSTGMEYDRQFTFAQLKSPFPVAANTPEKEKAAHKWEFITQEQFPLLAKVRTEMWVPDQSVESYTPHCEDVESEGVIILSFPYQEAGWKGTFARWGARVKGTYPEKQFRIPFNPTEVQVEKSGYTYEKMTIWKEDITALNMEADIPEELRYYLGISNKLGLFRIDNSKAREVQSNELTGFQDASPLHMINLASVRAVEREMPRVKGVRLSAARFRANLIITGPDAFHEDSWRKIKIGYYEYDVSPLSERYSTPSVDQITGERYTSESPLRSFRDIEGTNQNIDRLGMQMLSLSKESQVRVGDEITVLEVAAHC